MRPVRGSRGTHILLSLMQDIHEYREAIYQAMIAMTDAEGLPLVSAEEARRIIDDFTDEELEDGILYNSPGEVAAILLLD